MKFFFDNNLSPDLARGMAKLRRNFGEEVVHLRDRFDDPSVADEVWLTNLIDEGGWVVLSIDRFKKNAAERQAIANPEITVFMFSASFAKQQSWKKTTILVNRWEEIVAASQGRGRGKCYTVRLRGKIERIAM